MKKCIKCNKEKEFIYFYKHPKCKDGYNTICKTCKLEYNKLYSKKNKEKISEYQKKYNLDNFEILQKNKKDYRIKNNEYLNNKSKEKYNQNKDVRLKKQKIYYLNNKEKVLKLKKEYNQKNKEKLLLYKKEWALKNKENIFLKRKEYYNNKMKTDSVFKFKHNMRSLVKNSFKRCLNGIYKKTQKTENILGCSVPFFLEYIKSKFKDNMSFNNHGEWHLDHIIPLSIATNEEEIIKLNHYTNFQPLWAKENLLKSNKIIN